jgi:hypothetical protein
VNRALIIRPLQIYPSRALAVQTRYLRKFSLLRLLFGWLQSRDVMPVILALRHHAELRNLNPKHLDYMCDLDANRCDGATQRDE